MPRQRNKMDFDRDNLQWLYHRICYEMIPFQVNNFVYPAIKPNYALMGWENSTKIKLFPNEDKEKEKEMVKIFKELKEKGLFSHVEVKNMMLHYHAVSKWSHIAELIVEFRNVV